jgi:phosphoenolpyruvate---glycerone phosphotransferase subunit DhaL
MAIDVAGVQRWIELFAQEMAEHRQELVGLDTAIGDGDHGTNMDRGMQRAAEKLAAEPATDPGALLKTVAMTLISTVGGAAGPLYGTLFLQLGGGLTDHPEGDLRAYAAAWRRALDGVQARGKAQAGDKTMLDALIPAVEALEQAAEAGTELGAALHAAADAAREGMLATVPLVARRGRASYLGERSAGHQDPGATSTHYLLESAAQALAG